MRATATHLTIDTRSPIPVYVQIMNQIRDQVLGETLRPGIPLPAVRQLAEDLGLNPNTVAKAYSLLEREGLLQTVARRGTFVAESAPAKAVRGMDRRVEDAVSRVLSETAAAGIDRTQLLAALRRELEDERGSENRRHGR